jgi:hypothetical protein
MHDDDNLRVVSGVLQRRRCCGMTVKGMQLQVQPQIPPLRVGMTTKEQATATSSSSANGNATGNPRHIGKSSTIWDWEMPIATDMVVKDCAGFLVAREFSGGVGSVCGGDCE